MEWSDAYSIVLMLFQGLIILYATSMLPTICSRLRRAWRYFILALCGMFFSRVFFSMDCFEVYKADLFIEALLTINSSLMVVFLLLTKRGLREK